VSSGWTDVPTSTDGRPAAEALVESMRWQRSVGGGTMQVRLRPEHFGDVTVTVQVHQGQVSATLAAESPAAVEYLQREADTLRDMLHERGLVLARFEIRDRDGEARRDRHQQASRDLPRRRADHAQTQDIFEVVV
jgi:flagellar hook-length control protein FliK